MEDQTKRTIPGVKRKDQGQDTSLGPRRGGWDGNEAVGRSDGLNERTATSGCQEEREILAMPLMMASL